MEGVWSAVTPHDEVSRNSSKHLSFTALTNKGSSIFGFGNTWEVMLSLQPGNQIVENEL